MMATRCPNDMTTVVIPPAGSAVCPSCKSVLVIPAIVLALTCEHQPRPVRGVMSVAGDKVPYEYCSGECKAEHLALYPSDIREVVA